MLYKSSKCQVVSFVYNGKKSLFRKLMSQFIMGWGRRRSFEILFMLIQLREFVSSLVRLGREENLHVLINISCHNGRGGGGRGGGGVGRQRRHRFDLERSAAPTARSRPRHCRRHRFRHPRAHVKRRRAVSDAEIKQFSEKEAGPPTHSHQGTG